MSLILRTIKQLEQLEFDVTAGLKPPTQKQRILTALQLNKKHGLLNTALNKICFRYGARIFELRREGHDITTERVRQGVYRFKLNSRAKKVVQ